MFSQTVEYALRAVVHLAAEAPAPRTTDQIAVATRVPKAYLSKVLQGLSRGGIVHSQRGIGGGMTLTKDPADLTILEVVNAVEPLGRIRECPLGLAAHGVRLCPLAQATGQCFGDPSRLHSPKPHWPKSWPSRPTVRPCVKCPRSSR